MSKSGIQKVVLAYSGGLDTSAIVPWLVDELGCEVVAFVADVGQGEHELDGIEEKARASGASGCYVYDLREEFVTDYIYPTVQAGSVYEGRYLLGTSMARPLIAMKQVELAREVGADAVAHGCTGKGNDQVRFEATFAALAPDLKVIAPWRTWGMRSREDLLAYLAERGIETTASKEKIYSRDANLWHISHEGGLIESTTNPPPADAWTLTADPSAAPDVGMEVALSFDRGTPTAINGERVGPLELIERLNAIGSVHGVGRVDLVENRTVGMKSRGLYETPGGTILMEAYASLEELVYDRDAMRLRQDLGLKFGDLVYTGKWFTQTREAIQAGVASLAARVTGEVTVKLFKGHATAITRSSPNSLYSEDFATFGEDEVYHQGDAEGFIRLFTLPERIAALSKQHASGGKA
ncbi:MAG: argininosuccinate synthase [Planctomycetota bacterium]